MILLWKAVALEMGEQGVQAHTQKFWFAEKLGNIPENPGKNGAQRCITSKNCAHGLQKNTWRPSLEVASKKVLTIFVEENL